MNNEQQPSPEQLLQTAQFVKVLRDPTSPQHQEAQRHLEATQANPAFLSCLALVFAKAPVEQVPSDVRQLAGLLVKNYVVKNTQDFLRVDTSTVRETIKSQALIAVRDPDERVRNVASILIVTIAAYTFRARRELAVAWPELFPTLIEMLGSRQLASAEGALSSTVKILEDCGPSLQADENGEQALNQLVSVLPSLFSSEDPRIRASAVKATNLMIPLRPAPLMTHLEEFIQALAVLKDDASSLVRQGVCQALVALFREAFGQLLSKLPEVMEFMLSKSQDKDEIVAREATEFWTVFCEYTTPAYREIPALLQGFLPRLFPVLLNGMVHTESERQSILADSKLQLDSVPDREQDLAPMHYHGRAACRFQQSSRQQTEQNGFVDDYDEEDDEEEEGRLGGAGNEVHQWTLRRCSAATVDVLADFFGPDIVLPILLPLLYTRLQAHSAWETEAAVLALGAVSSCLPGMRDQLPQLYPFLLQQLDNQPGMAECPALGSTLAWTLSRYARWVLEEDDDARKLAPLIEGLLRSMLNRNKKVQQAACSALSTLEEEAGARIMPYMSHILSFMAEALHRYQTRSIIVLFDTLGTLADSVAHEPSVQEHLAAFMPKLWDKWRAFSDRDRSLLYLMECLTSLCPALGVAFLPYAPDACQRCLRLVQQMVEDDRLQQETDRTFAVCALDLLTGMVEALANAFGGIISHSDLLQLLAVCTQDPADEVRQSAFALLGDLAKYCPEPIVNVTANIVPILINNLNTRSYSVCNNASWAIGELTVKAGFDAIAPFVPAILAQLTPIFTTSDLTRGLVENATITVGRLAKVCPVEVAAHAKGFLYAWCINLQEVTHRGEKEHAFEGLCLVLQQNPELITADGPMVQDNHRGGRNTYEAFAWAVASWYDSSTGQPAVPERLNHMLKVILHYIKEHLQQQIDWNVYISNLDPHLVQYLVTFYDL